MAIGVGLIMFVVGFVVGGMVAHRNAEYTIDILKASNEKAQRELDLLYEELRTDESWDDYDEDVNAIYE